MTLEPEVNLPLEGEQQQEAPKGPTIEDLAREQGWNPDHSGPDKLSAEEFVRRKPLFDKIHAQSRELKEIKRSVAAMADTYKSMSEAQYRRGIADAQKRMDEAEASFNVAAFKEAQQEKSDLESASRAIPKVDPVPAEVEDFCERNPWFDKDKVMQVDALEYKDRYLKRNPSAPLKEVLEYVEARIKRDYPEKFAAASSPSAAKREGSASAVEGGGSASKGSADPLAKLEASMSAEEKRVMAMFTSGGKMTKAEYLKSYAEVREV